MSTRILFSFFLIISNINFAQVTNTSPYSYYGLGENEGIDQAVFGSLGQSTISYFDSTVLNTYNPATYNTLGKGQPLFSTGLSSRLSFYNQGSVSSFQKSVVINHLAFGMSLGKHFGVAAGLRPYTRRGYHFYSKDLVGTDSIKHIYEGSGSTNEVFIGFSSDILKLNNLRVAIGGNLGYLFNVVTNSRISHLIGSDSAKGGISEKYTELKAVRYQFGMYMQQKINPNHNYAVSVVLEPQQDLFAYQSENLFFATDINNRSTYSLLSATGLVAGHYKTAPSITLGINYSILFKDSKKENKIRNSELSFHINMNTTDWSVFSSTFENVATNFGWMKTSKSTFGIQYIPETLNSEKSVRSNFLEKTKYRVGMYQYSLPYTQNALEINDKGLTLGFGFPLLAQRSLSYINFGMNFGSRGTSDKNLLSEKYMGIQIGISFAPASFERWFVKRKLD